MTINIVRKMVAGYIILILVPYLFFGYHYYMQVYSSLSRQLAEGRQNILEQAYANLRTDFVRIQSVHRVLQYNPYLTDYLDDVYQTDAERVYAFIRHIQPLYSQSLFANPEIESLTIYKMKDNVLPIAEQVADYGLLDEKTRDEVRRLQPGQGKWYRVSPESAETELVYYQHIYNPRFTEILGLLEIRISSAWLRQFYLAAGVSGHWRAFLLSEQGQPLHDGVMSDGMDERTLRLVQSNDGKFFIDGKVIVNQIYVEELGVRVVVVGQAGDVFQTISQKEAMLSAMFIMLLIGLSVGYYLLASSISKRILRLARHMRSLTENNLKHYIVKSDKLDVKDEIGFLTATYNSMVSRMDELINNVHRAELRNKEAAYKVLQAQIKPHFLYNTLETIRMVAISNNDQEAAKLAFWFGKLMRYSLSSNQDQTLLSTEFEIAAFYLNIHMMRLQDRLTYAIDMKADADRIACPRFILQPILENVIVHSVSSTLRPVHIDIRATETSDEVRITVTDNGNGIPPDRLREIQARLVSKQDDEEHRTGGGVGLVNVNERIKAFFGDRSRIDISSEEGKGTTLCMIMTKREVSAS